MEVEIFFYDILAILETQYCVYMSRDMRLATMWYVRPAKAQTSLRIRAD